MNRKLLGDSALTVIGVAVLSTVFLLGFYIPERRAAAGVRKEIAVIEGTIRKVPARVAELVSLKRDIEIRRKFLRRAGRWTPADPDVSGVLKHVAQLARNSELAVTRQERMSPVPYASYKVMPFRISFRGRFTGIASFLKGLESHTRLVTFDEVSLKREDGRGAESTRADVYFSVYTGGREITDSNGNDASRNHRTSDIGIR